MGSRGSVIPLFTKLIKEKKEITITDPSMTRFMMSLDESVDLVIFAFKNAKPGEIFVQKAPATNMTILTQALCELMGQPNHPTRLIGTRHGEKRFESLVSAEEMVNSEDMGKYYRISPDLRSLNYSKYIDLGEVAITSSVDFNSDNADQLDVKSTKILLNKLKCIKATLNGKIVDYNE